MANQQHLSVPALAFRQGDDRILFTFAVEGKQLMEFATVSRISRTDSSELRGYQRPEVLSHIGNIRNYLSSETPLLPNALVLAFDDVVEFMPLQHTCSENVQAGLLKIPMDPGSPNWKKPAWIVDGQQRAAALQEAARENFYICVVAFVAKTPHEQREQFMLVNTTKPLSKGLLYELLPHTNCPLPGVFEKRRFPAYLLEKMNYDEQSPFFRKIKTATNPDGIIQDNSMLKMLENSLSDGVLYYIREASGKEKEEEVVECMLQVLYNFWTAVSAVFSTAWSLPPKRSRLTHGAGIISLGFIMDAIADRHINELSLDTQFFQSDLEKLLPICRWTYGYWELGPGAQRKWNEIQNTPTDIRLLSNYLLLQYKSLVWNDAIRYS